LTEKLEANIIPEERRAAPGAWRAYRRDFAAAWSVLCFPTLGRLSTSTPAKRLRREPSSLCYRAYQRG
jgi:hypothetical protein